MAAQPELVAAVAGSPAASQAPPATRPAENVLARPGETHTSGARLETMSGSEERDGEGELEHTLLPSHRT